MKFDILYTNTKYRRDGSYRLLYLVILRLLQYADLYPCATTRAPPLL